jgi:hypothetical protein
VGERRDRRQLGLKNGVREAQEPGRRRVEPDPRQGRSASPGHRHMVYGFGHTNKMLKRAYQKARAPRS